MAITSVDVDQAVLKEIKKITKAKTDREVINEALKIRLALLSQKEALQSMKKRGFAMPEIDPPVINYDE